MLVRFRLLFYFVVSILMLQKQIFAKANIIDRAVRRCTAFYEGEKVVRLYRLAVTGAWDDCPYDLYPGHTDFPYALAIVPQTSRARSLVSDALVAHPRTYDPTTKVSIVVPRAGCRKVPDNVSMLRLTVLVGGRTHCDVHANSSLWRFSSQPYPNEEWISALHAVGLRVVVVPGARSALCAEVTTVSEARRLLHHLSHLVLNIQQRSEYGDYFYAHDPRTGGIAESSGYYRRVSAVVATFAVVHAHRSISASVFGTLTLVLAYMSLSNPVDTCGTALAVYSVLVVLSLEWQIHTLKGKRTRHGHTGATLRRVICGSVQKEVL